VVENSDAISHRVDENYTFAISFMEKSQARELLCNCIEQNASAQKAVVLPRVPFDRAITNAQMQGKPVVEMEQSLAAKKIEKGWRMLSRLLF
jgi:MinD superfamily P-loop ATPase